MSLPKTPLISFVVPCYNYGRYLGDCLESILTQEGGFDFEIVLIDDGSIDNTEEVVSRYSDSRIRFIRHAQNLGHVATINEGLRETRGDFIARIDPDDRYRPHFLKLTLEKFEEFPDVGLVYGDTALVNEGGEVTLESCDRVHGGSDYKGNEFLKLLQENFICSPAVIARRETWLKTLPVPPNLAFHDWYFTLTMSREYDFYYLHRILADYRVHSFNHHSQIIRNKTEEVSLFWLLDRIFSEQEKNRALEEGKQRAKDRIYAAQYLTLANKYFGFGMDRDARRCYLQALRFSPHCLFRFDLLRRFAGTFLGRSAYERSKFLIQSVME